jgi:hypothetical protein
MIWARRGVSTFGVHPSRRSALAGLPTRASTSVGRMYRSSNFTYFCHSRPRWPKENSRKSRTVYAVLVATTKSSGSSHCSIRHIASTYSGAYPQSRTESRLPMYNSDCTPAAIRATARVILRVTNVSPRRGDSWLNRIPFVAKIPYASR